MSAFELIGAIEGEESNAVNSVIDYRGRGHLNYGRGVEQNLTYQGHHGYRTEQAP